MAWPTNTTATNATGGWTMYRWGWQFTGSEGLDEAYVPFFGAFGAAWDDGMVALPLALLRKTGAPQATPTAANLTNATCARSGAADVVPGISTLATSSLGRARK
jgi:hypothetical protein